MNYQFDHQEIRDAVRQLCQDFPGEYWRRCDREQAYPTEFVSALTQSGYLSALIPEEFGGAGLPISAGAAILETIHHSGCNAAACHAQMYTMGTVLRHGSDDQKQRFLPGIADGSLRLQPLASPNRPVALTRRHYGLRHVWRVMSTWLMDRKSGRRELNIQI